MGLFSLISTPATSPGIYDVRFMIYEPSRYPCDRVNRKSKIANPSQWRLWFDLRENLIKQEINHHPGHGNVHPQRPGPARDLLVEFKPLLFGAIQRHQNHRHDDHGQDRVRQEDGQVNRAEPQRVQKLRRPLVQDNRKITVVSEVTRQKNDGGDERRDHAVAVSILVFTPNEKVTGGQENGAEAVERGVDGGQIVDVHQSPSNSFTVAMICGRIFVQSISWPSV